MSKQIKQIKQGGLRRRLALGAAGARSGLGLLSSRARGVLVPRDQQQAHNDAALEREALRFVAHLGELKGAYVKIGQMLALYGEHILPKPITKALHTLEDQTSSLEWSSISELLEAELGKKLSQLQIEHTAFAAASLAQVHKARISVDGTSLALKIQYPGIAEAIDGDFDSVIQMLKLSRWLKAGRDVEQFTQQLKALLKQEVDYSLELSRLQRFKALLADEPTLRTPAVYPQWSTEKCLAMEYVKGYSVNDDVVQNLSQERRNSLAEAMLRLFFKEVFEWNCMQTDPNFGNYRIELDEQNGDRLVLLDFGAVHDLPESFTQPLRTAIQAAYRQDHTHLIAALIELKCLRASDTKSVKQSFAEFCCFIIEPFRSDASGVPEHAYANGVYDWRASRLLRRAGKLGSQSLLLKGFVMPPQEFMLLVRKLTGVFTFVSCLGAKINSSHLLEKYEQREHSKYAHRINKALVMVLVNITKDLNMVAQRIAIYGGNGFIGSHIAKQLASKRSEQIELCVLCLSRTGHKPVHLREESWSETVKWCVGDASQPDVKMLSNANTLICSIGSPPVPTFSKEAYEQQVHANGTVNASAIKAAGEAGLKRLVLVSAKLPKFMQRDSFGYAKGKRISEEAALKFAALSDEHRVLILRPGMVYGTRYTASGKAIPLGTVFGPLGKVMKSQFTGVEQLAERVSDFVLMPENYSDSSTILTAQEI